ncbi:MAG TPA: DUF3108 domain-containing protein [Candidatus Binatia bacterium]|nr:DUF3108 domain-containing protein [Candidatus Binatia bacterium]
MLRRVIAVLLRREARAAAVALAVLVGAAHPCAARAATGPTGLSLAYDVYYLAFRVLSVESTTVVEPAGYRTNSFMQTVGFIGTLFPWESRSSAFGSIDGSRFVPGEYRLRSLFRGRNIEVDLRYADGGRVVERLGGDLGTGERAPIPEEERENTLDPLSAAVSLSHELERTGTCAVTRRVFDGVRRYDLQYEDLGMVELEPASGDGFGGPARLCKASVRPIGGFLVSGEGAGEAPHGVSAWLGPPLPGAAPVPLRLDLEGARGTLHAYLQRAEPTAGGAGDAVRTD